jgi:hypothetical protein
MLRQQAYYLWKYELIVLYKKQNPTQKVWKPKAVD